MAISLDQVNEELSKIRMKLGTRNTLHSISVIELERVMAEKTA